MFRFALKNNKKFKAKTHPRQHEILDLNMHLSSFFKTNQMLKYTFESLFSNKKALRKCWL